MHLQRFGYRRRCSLDAPEDTRIAYRPSVLLELVDSRESCELVVETLLQLAPAISVHPLKADPTDSHSDEEPWRSQVDRSIHESVRPMLVFSLGRSMSPRVA